jgi:hypothetical protein
MKPFDILSSNQSLQLLWILEKENDKYELELTKEEISHIRFCLLEDWKNLTTPYKKHLITTDKLGILALLSNNLPIFN